MTRVAGGGRLFFMFVLPKRSAREAEEAEVLP